MWESRKQDARDFIPSSRCPSLASHHLPLSRDLIVSTALSQWRRTYCWRHCGLAERLLQALLIMSLWSYNYNLSAVFKASTRFASTNPDYSLYYNTVTGTWWYIDCIFCSYLSVCVQITTRLFIAYGIAHSLGFVRRSRLRYSIFPSTGNLSWPSHTSTLHLHGQYNTNCD